MIKKIVDTRNIGGYMEPPKHIQEIDKINSSRNYGIDALRIISMVMIITHHILVHGGII